MTGWKKRKIAEAQSVAINDTSPERVDEIQKQRHEPVGCIPWHWVDKAKQIADGPIAHPDAERAQQAIALIKILLKSTPPQRKKD